MRRRWRAWRARRLIDRMSTWSGMPELTLAEAGLVASMRRGGKTPAFAVDRIKARRSWARGNIRGLLSYAAITSRQLR